MRNRWLVPAVLGVLVWSSPSAGAQTARRGAWQTVANQLAEIQRAGGDHLGYTREALDVLSRTFKITPHGYRPLRRQSGGRGTADNGFDVLSLFSGGLAIRESLQLDRLAAMSGGEGTVDVRTLAPPSTPSHPFQSMLRGREWKASDLARSVPHDFYYANIRSLRRALDFADYLDEVGGLIIKRYAPTAVDFHVKDKILTQLALRVNPAARTFYDAVIAEVAITGSDPFLRAGTDISILYKLKSSLVFRATIATHWKHFRETLGATEREVTVAGTKALCLSTGDGAVHALLLELEDDLVVLSNSERALATIVATHQKKRESVHDLADFRYMRSIYPRGAAAEDGFLYLSDAFIRRLVGPALRIKEARRMAEAMRIASLERYAILHYQLTGRHAATVADVFAPFPKNARLRDAFSGLELIPGTFTARSLRYGRIGYFRSNWEIDLQKVSDAEAEGYRRFVREYERYWRTYFDPIGIRFKKGKTTRFDVCILPLIDSSIYQSIQSLLGGRPVALTSRPLPGEVLSLNLKFDPRAREFGLVREMEQEFGREFGERFDLMSHLGDEIEVHALDVRPLLDFDGGFLLRRTLPRMGRRRDFDMAWIVMLAYSAFHPIRLSVALRDPKRGDALLEELDRVLAKIKAGLSQENQDDFSVLLTHYRFEHNGKIVRVVRISFAQTLHVRLFYAVHDGRLHITTTEEHMKKLLDRPAGDGGAAPAVTSGGDGNALLVLRPSEMKLERSTFERTVAERAMDVSLANAGTIRLLSLLFPKERDLTGRCLKTFGFEPISPVGGRYTVDPATGVVHDSAFGTRFEPTLNVETVRAATGMQRFFSTARIDVLLKFTPEGIMTTVEIR